MWSTVALALLLAAGADAVAEYERGAAAFRAGRLDEAVAAFRAAVQADPRNAQAWKALGVTHAARGDYGMADEPFDKACRLEPKLVDACYYLARNRYATNRFEESLEALKKAEKHDAKPWRIHLALAQAFEALGRNAQAEQEFERAIRKNNGAPPEQRMRPEEDPRIAYAVFLFRAGRTRDTLKPLESALRDYPQSGKAHLELGRSLFHIGRLEDALSHAKQAAALDSQSPAAQLLVGKILVQLGRVEEAQPYLERGRTLEQRP